MLILDWEDSLETIGIEIDSLCKKAVRAVKTSKVRIVRERPTTIWRVRCSLEDNGSYQIKVKYAEKDQRKDLRRWLEEHDHRDYFRGITTIFVEVDPRTGRTKKRGRFKWSPVAKDGTLEGKWRAVDGPRPTRSVKQQVRDWRLRADVLAEDRMCVVSGEKMTEVLDAAHIVPVEERGPDNINNAIMLRTDVHRLYDSGMFLIKPKDGTICMRGDLSDKYKKLLRNAELPKGTLNRVKKALKKKWKDSGRNVGNA